MANLWRRQPSFRLKSRNLVRKRAVDASTLIAEGFFEAAPPPPPALQRPKMQTIMVG